MNTQEIIRKHKANLGTMSGVLAFIADLRQGLSAEIKDKFKSEADRIREENKQQIESAVAAQIPNLEKVVKGLENMESVDENTKRLSAVVYPKLLVALNKKIKPASEKTLLSLIRPLIPKVKNGRTPTAREILAIVKPYLPEKGVDGDTPTDDHLRSLIKEVLPEEGSEETALTIAGKLNEKEALIDPKVIKGLGALLEGVRKALREHGGGGKGGGGGGGMGNWVHQQFSISSATTSVTVNSKVAASGMAHMLRYQGQFLALNVQYSVSADRKTFALLFTPEDNTVIDVTYVRS